MIVTETWLKPDNRDSEFIDERYFVFKCDRNRLATGKSDRGGFLVAVRRELKTIRVNTQFNHGFIEQPVWSEKILYHFCCVHTTSYF